jgi:septal ring-binding cell division protein DamX
MHATGRGMPKDYAAAHDWFEKAAAQGVSQAQFNLGVFYENGYGVERNLDTARKWYERAAAQGLAEGRAKLEQLDAMADASPIAHPDDLAAAAKPARDPSSTRVYDPHTDGPRMAAAATSAGPDPAPGSPAPAPAASAAPAPAPAAPVPAPTTAATPPPAPAASPATGTAPTDSLRRETWVRAQNPDSFTLQIGSVTSEKDVRRFLQENGIEAEAGYIAVQIDGTTRYNALYGSYPSYAEAQRAVTQLPPALQQIKPWIRNFGILQQLLK